MTAVAGHVTTGRTGTCPAARGGARARRCPGWPRGWSCSASTRVPATASRRRWCGGPTARSSRCPRCCTRWPAGSTASVTRRPSRRWSAPTWAGHWPPGRFAISSPPSCCPSACRRRGRPGAVPRANPLFSLRARATLLPERVVNPLGRSSARCSGGPSSWPWSAACGRGLVAVRRPRAGRRDPASPARPGGLARRARPVPGLRRVPRVRARGRLPVRRRAARRDRRGHLPGLAVVLHQRHRLLPALPGRAAADRPRRPVFQPIFMLALAGIYVATSAQVLLLVIAVTHLEMLDQLLPFVRFDGYFILSRPDRRAGPVRPRRPHREKRAPGAAGTRASPACGAAPGSW